MRLRCKNSPLASITEANGWEECPVPKMLGVPLMAKAIRPYRPPENFPSRQLAVFMMVEPHTGLAPVRWQLGPHCNLGMIGFARKDGKPFTCKQWRALHGYIFDLMDAHSESEFEPRKIQAIIRNKLNPNAFGRSHHYIPMN